MGIQAGEYLKRELTKIACGTYQGETDLDLLEQQWKTPWGIELCKRCQFPTSEFFKSYESELVRHNVFRHQLGLQFYNRDIVLVGSSAVVEFNLPQKAYTVLLYHGSSVVVKARNCAVVKVVDITGDGKIEVEKTDTADVTVK